MMRILVISDLHIGDAARGKDLRVGDHDKWLDENYINDFIVFVSKRIARVDYLLIAGDISNRGGFDELRLGKNVINRIVEGLKISKEKVVIVPGNHDVDWDVLRLRDGGIGSAELRKSQRYDPFKKVFCDDEKVLKLFDKPYFTSWDFEGLFVVGFNSGWDDDNEKYVHNGKIDDEVISQIEKHIKESDAENKIKLFITHHHLFQFSDKVSDITDVSIMVNAENLIRMLARNRFDMVVHGHKHVPRIFTQDIDALHPISYLCAGSFSAILNQRLSGHVLNMFHVIDFDEVKDEGSRVHGFVENYSYSSPHKWLESKRLNAGVLPKEGFGSYSCMTMLLKEILPEMAKILNEENHILWKKFCLGDKRLLYHTAEYIDVLIDGICDALNLKKYPTDVETILMRNDD